MCSVFIAMSLDGFIARVNGDLDWLDKANPSVPQQEDFGYRACIDSVDALIMGRNTVEKVLSFGQWPYEEKPVLVLSTKKIPIPQERQKTVSQSSEHPKELCERLAGKGYTQLYIDGGATIQRFLSQRLIKDLIMTIIPVILGSGIRLFDKVPHDIELIHINTQSFDFGFVQLTYTL